VNREQRAEPFRHERVERALLEELRSLISAEVRDPLLSNAWAVDVQLSSDGKNARVSYAVRVQGDESAVARETKEAFKRAAGFLRSRVAGTLDLKRTPQLSFVFIGLMAEDNASPEIRSG
jgi:ribosome-binding factor A